MVGALTGDLVSATGNFSYQDAIAGNNKTIVADHLALTGADKGNYTLKATVASEVGAVITKATLTIPPPTASAITYGETLADSRLTPSGLPIPGHWEWADDTTKPTASGYFPAIFIPDDATNYEVYGPVDVFVTVNGGIIAGGGDFGGGGGLASGGNFAGGGIFGGIFAGDGSIADGDDGTASNGNASALAGKVFDTPNTGDSTHTTHYLFLIVLSCFGIAASIIFIVLGKREAREHPQIACDSLTEYRTYNIAAVMYLTLSQQVMDTFYTVPEDDDAFANLVAQIEANALYDTGVCIEAGDQLLALSTCSSHKDDERFVVFAVNGEK